MISIIVAMAENNAIGRNNSMPWHISDDLKFFRKTTSGHPIIMGYNTYLSIGSKPLPNRRNIVLTSKVLENEGIEVFTRFEDAVAACRGGIAEGSEEIFIIGGGQVYAAAMDIAERLYITEVEMEVKDAEVYFPEVQTSIWTEVSRSEKMVDEKSGVTYSFVTYERRN